MIKRNQSSLGIDLSDKTANYCAMNADDGVVAEGKVGLRVARLAEMWRRYGPVDVVVMEAGTPSTWVQELFEGLGARVIVAQGAEAGGHGERRGTITLVPEVADWLAGHAPEVLLLAAGGIADGRGLAAALMLGADGVLVGSRLWASQEAVVSDAMTDAAIAATGDQTIRSRVMDAARGLRWPDRYTARVLRNPVTDRWHDDPEALRAAAAARADWAEGWAAGDPARANTFVGEATGLIHDRPPVATIIEGMVAGAEALLRRAPGLDLTSTGPAC